jgi:HK97 family phage major capsid protein
MKKHEQLLAEATELAKDARGIFAKAEGENRDLTGEERAEYEAKFTAANDKMHASEEARKDADQLAKLDAMAASDGRAPDAQSHDQGTKSRLMGDRFVKSASYAGFRQQHPSGVGGSDAPVNIPAAKVGGLKEYIAQRKAAGDLIVGADASLQNIRMPMMDMLVRPRPTILDLINTSGSAAGDFEYLQITGVTRSAAIVPQATAITDDLALKPLSDLGTALAYARAYTYADGFPVTNQLLSDAPALAAFMNNELRYNLDRLLEDKVMNGTGAAGQPTGLEFTSGTQALTYPLAGVTIDLVKAIRKAITKVEITGGGSVTGIALSAEDDEAIDLMQDSQTRFFGQGPFGTGPNTLWGRPRVVSDKIVAGTAWVGEWNQIALLDREGLSILAFNQHSDWARRNLTYIRAELRAMQVIWRPVRFCKVTRAAA